MPRKKPIASLDDAGALRRLWALERDVAFLNHGSFGACPIPILEEQARLRLEMERNPVAFLARRLPALLEWARHRAAEFLGADPDSLAFVPNATTGVVTALANLDLRRGDRILLTDHAYPAVTNAAARVAERARASVDVVTIPVPLPDDADVLDRIAGAIGPRTRALVVEHVTSPTAVVLPVAAVLREARARGVFTIVDGAHAPGMLDVDLASLPVDAWTGNMHKWVCAPKGAAVLAVAREHRDAFRPLVTSLGAGGGFRAELDWTGTHDPTPFLCVPAAIELLGSLGWSAVRCRNHGLVLRGREVIAEATGTESLADDARVGSMAAVRLPAGTASSAAEALALQARLFDEDRIEVPVIWWNDVALVRVSAHIYNELAEYRRLADALTRLIRPRRGGSRRAVRRSLNGAAPGIQSGDAGGAPTP